MVELPSFNHTFIVGGFIQPFGVFIRLQRPRIHNDLVVFFAIVTHHPIVVGVVVQSSGRHIVSKDVIKAAVGFIVGQRGSVSKDIIKVAIGLTHCQRFHIEHIVKDAVVIAPVKGVILIFA